MEAGAGVAQLRRRAVPRESWQVREGFGGGGRTEEGLMLRKQPGEVEHFSRDCKAVEQLEGSWGQMAALLMPDGNTDVSLHGLVLRLAVCCVWDLKLSLYII